MNPPAARDVKVFVPARDFDGSLRFYTALGWRLNWRDGGLAEVELAGARLYLQDYYAREWAENFMIYVDVADAAAWHDHVAAVLADGAFPTARVAPPKGEPYGATVTYAWDPCGVLIHFAQRVVADTADLAKAHLRVARPTDDLGPLLTFYRDGLGFEVIGSFTDHDGFDGVMLGRAGSAYHLEFTRKAGHAAGKAPTEDNLLVYYLPDEGEYKAAVRRMEAAGFAPVKAFNPYWDVNGKTFEDADGYRVVLQNSGR